MENDIVLNFNSLADLIAQRVKSVLIPEIDNRFAQLSIQNGPPKRIKGNNNLALELKVDEKTICNWKKSGLLDSAIIFEMGRTIIYDLDKALECRNNRKVKSGRPKKTKENE